MALQRHRHSRTLTDRREVYLTVLHAKLERYAESDIASVTGNSRTRHTAKKETLEETNLVSWLKTVS